MPQDRDRGEREGSSVLVLEDEWLGVSRLRSSTGPPAASGHLGGGGAAWEAVGCTVG